MESGAEFSDPQDTSTVRVAEKIRAAKKERNHWCTDANWPRLKEALVNSWYPYLRGQCCKACLELGFDPVPKQTEFNVLRRIVRKPISYDNVLPVNKRSLLPEIQVKYVEYITIKIDITNLGMSRKEVIQVISELGQAN